MGVTIHYHGGVDDPAQLEAALAMLREECLRHDWPYEEHDFEASGTFETYVSQSVPSDLPDVEDSVVGTDFVELDTRWRGLIVQPHPDSESLVLMFDPQLGRLMMLMDAPGGHSLSYYLHSKTQFAPIETHVAACEMLHRLQDEFGSHSLHVSDEGEYYATGDLAKLRQKRDLIDEALNNPELIARLLGYAAVGDNVEPPDAAQMAGRLN